MSWVKVSKVSTIETFKLNKSNNYTYNTNKNINILNCVPIISKMLMYQYQDGFDLKLIKNGNSIQSELLSSRADVAEQYIVNATQGGGDFEEYIYNLNYNIPRETKLIDILASLSIWKYHFDRGYKTSIKIAIDNNIIATLNYSKTLDIYQNDFGLKYISLQIEGTVRLPENHNGALTIKMYTDSDNFALFQAQGGDFIHTSCYVQTDNKKHELDYEIEVLYVKEV